MHRRALVSSLAAGAVAPLMPGIGSHRHGGIAAAQTPAPIKAPDDGLAHPIPMTPPLGVGKDRALVLSGGGLYMTTFYVGFFNELLNQGIDLDSMAEVVVGTSAGSVGGALLTGKAVPAAYQLFEAFGQFPFLFDKVIPGGPPSPSSQRAHEMVNSVKVATLETTRAVGAAAMAAKNASGPDEFPGAIETLLGFTEWPSETMHTTANDCYTGERLVVSQKDDIPINVACAASGSMAGTAGPVWMKDRFCMDGAVSQSNTHCDVVAGSKRALVISLTEGGDSYKGTNLANAGGWLPIQDELDALEKGGTKTMLIVCGLEPGMTKIDSNMDPKLIAGQLKWGAQKAKDEAAKIKEFWA